MTTTPPPPPANAGPWDDFTLSAYIDAELDAETADAIDRAARQDSDLRGRIDTLHRTSAEARRAGLEALSGPPSASLLETMNRLADALNERQLAALAPSTVVPFAPRAATVPPPRRRWTGSAMAAAIGGLAALAAAWWVLPHGQSPEAAREVTLAALRAQALEHLPSGTPASATAEDSNLYSVIPVRTWRNTDGTYCREFDEKGPAYSSSGVACRLDGTWKIRSPISPSR